jgi:hypothetical protein
MNGVGQEAPDKVRNYAKSAVPLRVASRPEDITEVVHCEFRTGVLPRRKSNLTISGRAPVCVPIGLGRHRATEAETATQMVAE